MKRLAISMMVFCCVMALSVAAWCGDNGDGTVTVNGLVWMKDAGCMGYTNWNTAMGRVKTIASGQCDLTDKSKPGDWRLPTVDELRAIYASKSQFKDVVYSFYWSSSRYEGAANRAWVVGMNDGSMHSGNKDSHASYVWPVRKK